MLDRKREGKKSTCDGDGQREKRLKRNSNALCTVRHNRRAYVDAYSTSRGLLSV